MKIVILGLSITSSWGNGHATTYRGLVKELDALGHDVLFLERDVPWYASNRDLPNPPYCRTKLYQDIVQLKDDFGYDVINADVVIVGSYVPQGVDIGNWATSVALGVTAFYDIDTPVTLAKLQAGDEEYLSRRLIPQYQLYLSFCGGPTLEKLEREYGSPMARPLYCSFDPSLYFPEQRVDQWDLGYMGTYSDDRQPGLEKLLIEPSKLWFKGRFVVAGPQFPESIKWPANVERIEHLAPSEHRAFYNSQRFTLNITRAAMIDAGYSPSVRLFEAAACGVPIISDYWNGLDSFFEIGSELLVSNSSQKTLEFLTDMPEAERVSIGQKARTRVLNSHTAAQRATELIGYIAKAAPIRSLIANV